MFTASGPLFQISPGLITTWYIIVTIGGIVFCISSPFILYWADKKEREQKKK